MTNIIIILIFAVLFNTTKIFIMYSAIQSSKKMQINLTRVLDSCWKVWNIGLTEGEDVIKVWNVIFDANGMNRSGMIGWDNEYNMPVFSTSIYQDFEYDSELSYEDECHYTVFSELLLTDMSEGKWKLRLLNYLTWLGYIQYK